MLPKDHLPVPCFNCESVFGKGKGRFPLPNTDSQLKHGTGKWSFGNISPFSKNGFAVEILTLQQNQLPQKSAGQKPTTCWQQKLSQVKGQLRPSFFQRNVPQAEFKQVSPGSNMDQQTTCTDILGNSNASQHNEVL